MGVWGGGGTFWVLNKKTNSYMLAFLCCQSVNETYLSIYRKTVLKNKFLFEYEMA